LRRLLIIGNWKMNKTASEAAAFIRDLRERVPASPNADVVLAPPFTALESARNALGPPAWISLALGMYIGSSTGLHRRSVRSDVARSWLPLCDRRPF
jgi:triosephosphate isomerase